MFVVCYIWINLINMWCFFGHKNFTLFSGEVSEPRPSERPCTSFRAPSPVCLGACFERVAKCGTPLRTDGCQVQDVCFFFLVLKQLGGSDISGMKSKNRFASPQALDVFGPLAWRYRLLSWWLRGRPSGQVVERHVFGLLFFPCPFQRHISIYSPKLTSYRFISYILCT